MRAPWCPDICFLGLGTQRHVMAIVSMHRMHLREEPPDSVGCGPEWCHVLSSALSLSQV